MSTFHQLMTLDQSSAHYTHPPIPTAGPATEPDGPRSFAFVPALGFLVAHPPPPPPSLLQAQREDVQGQEIVNDAQDVAAVPDAGSSTGAGANHYPSSAGVPRLPPILQVEKQQVIFGLILKRDHSSVNGRGATRVLHASMIANAIKLSTIANPSRTSVTGARRPSAGWMHSMFRHLRSDGGAECRAKHAMKLASPDQNASSSQAHPQVPPAILHLQTPPQVPLQVPPKLQVPP
ncbi:hypothetical protein EV360DRAFT_82406 [Lentinula raphanica]|nr:hypothetical protein EV360DRAFT_82406 [Lentinula raphanica]